MRSIGARRALAVAVAVLVGLCGTSSASAAEPPDHMLDGVLTGELLGLGEQFKDACGVAVDGEGDIYVADYYQGRVVVFHGFEYLTQIRDINPLDPGGVGPINGPCDLAVDSSGNLYVNDYHGEVVRYTPAQYPPVKGTTYGSKMTIDPLASTGIAVEPGTDRLYVDNRTFLAVYEPDGAPVMNGATPLHVGEGSLDDGYSVAVSGFTGTEGLVYVSDAGAETVKIYDPALDPENPQGQISGEGTEQGHLYLTDTDLAVDPEDGHLYVAQNLEPLFEERPEAVVDEFSPAGFYRGPVPRSYANGTPSFLEDGEPSSLAVSAKGNLYVTSGNYEDASVVIFGPPAPTEAELLAISKIGSGQGRVTSIPAAIGCGTVCQGEFTKSTTAVLEATPAAGSDVVGWTGCEEMPSPDSCAVRMNVARAVSVEFGPIPTAAGLAEPSAANPHTSAAEVQGAAAAPAQVAPPSRKVKKRPGALSHRRHRHHRHRHNPLRHRKGTR